MEIPPSEEEQQRYYYGLPSQPKLVARSSTTPWRPQQDQWPIGKLLDPVGKHKIVGLWNDSTGPLRRDILNAVAYLNWTAIDILRIGYERKNELTGEIFDHPVTLFISVGEDSTPWPLGHATVMQCFRILQQYGIIDVNVEMKESRVTPFASHPPASPILLERTELSVAPPTIPKLSAAAVSEPLDFHGLFSEYLGQCIASSDLTAEGTKCLYLRDRNNGKILALTCRHVVFSSVHPTTEYRYDGADTTLRRTVLQPGNKTWAKLFEDATSNVAVYDKDIKRIEDHEQMDPSIKTERLASMNDARAFFRDKEQMLRQLEDPATRVIGHVLFSPEFGTGVTRRAGQRVRDWALIELHQGKHSSDLGRLRNRVVAPKKLHLEVKDKTRAEFGEVSCTLACDKANTVALVGTIPDKEMYDEHFQAISASLHEPAIMVLKNGQKTGLTIGLASQVKSVVRRPHGDISVVSEEWCILGHKKNNEGRREAFSEPGDSGACVFDTHGRVGGMLTARLEKDATTLHDVSYATPIEWLLEDIKGYGFDVELLGARVEQESN